MNLTTNHGDAGFDWAVDREAALRERFPSIDRVRHERPGCEADRGRQVFFHEQNHSAVQRIARSRIEQEADADEFIAAAQQRHRKRLQAWAKKFHQQHVNEETRTA